LTVGCPEGAAPLLCHAPSYVEFDATSDVYVDLRISKNCVY
jgi:hypothetical protein